MKKDFIKIWLFLISVLLILNLIFLISISFQLQQLISEKFEVPLSQTAPTPPFTGYLIKIATPFFICFILLTIFILFYRKKKH